MNERKSKLDRGAAKGCFLLGVDVGTTATKVSLFDLRGTTVASATEEYSLITPSALEVELEIEMLWKYFIKGIKRVILASGTKPSSVKALGISAQGETLVPIDRTGRPLRRAIVWLDSRAQKESEILENEFDNEKSYRITGQVRLVPTWPASKILWIKRHEPDVFEKAYKYLLVEDYLLWKMTGKFVSEGSLLCSTYYWNIVSKKWWKEMLDFIGIHEGQLSEIREPGEEIGEILPEVAQHLGLNSETIACTGGLDQACGAIGVGNIRPGMFTVNIGAALAICATLGRPVFDKKRRIPIHYHAIPNIYMAHTFTTGGMVLRWFRDTFCDGKMVKSGKANISPYQLIDREVSHVAPGSEGLVMLPHLQGAMAPEADPKAKGVFFGFTLRHRRPYFARSIMEAIACIIRRNIDALEDSGIKVGEIRALGGGARSRVWNQIVADLSKKPVATTLHDEDAACLGAAILAGKATGLFKSLEAATEDMVAVGQRFEPNKKNFPVYDELYLKYVRLYESLQNLFTSD